MSLLGPFTVDPPEKRSTRPEDTYDVCDGFMDVIVPNLTFETARYVADSLNQADEA
jgi:hypothetical protein